MIEKALADRLRRAGKEERKRLYPEVYDELFRSVPDLPQHTEQQSPTQRKVVAAKSAARLRPFLTSVSTFLEIGAGDLALAVQVAPHVGRVYAVDVSSEITGHGEMPPNVQLILSDGSSIPLSANSVDLAYSDQLMEHLHPDDAPDQLRNVVRAIKPGGRYICLTPSRISGPHDISMYFSDEPTGLHLREYTTTELVRMFKAAGFSHVAVPVPVPLVDRFMVLPASPVTIVEAMLGCLPRRTSRALAKLPVVWPLLSRVIATK